MLVVAAFQVRVIGLGQGSFEYTTGGIVPVLRLNTFTIERVTDEGKIATFNGMRFTGVEFGHNTATMSFEGPLQNGASALGDVQVTREKYDEIRVMFEEDFDGQ